MESKHTEVNSSSTEVKASSYPDVSASWTVMNAFYSDIYQVLRETPLIELLDDPEFHLRVLPAINRPSPLYSLFQEKMRDEAHSRLTVQQFVPRWESYLLTMVWNEDSYRTNNPVSNISFTKGEFVDLLALEPFVKVALRHTNPAKASSTTYNTRSRFMLKAKSHTALVQYDGENDAWTYSVSRVGGFKVAKYYPAGSYAEALDLIEITIRLSLVNQDIENLSDVLTQLREMEGSISNASNVLIRIESEGETNPVFKELVNAIRNLGVLRNRY